MPQAFRELTDRIAKVLREQWDPLEVGDLPPGKDEYQDYVTALAGRIRQGASTVELASLLLDIERKDMGLPGDPARARRVAETLQALRD